MGKNPCGSKLTFDSHLILIWERDSLGYPAKGTPIPRVPPSQGNPHHRGTLQFILTIVLRITFSLDKTELVT